MKNKIQCSACGKRRNSGHEKRCGTKDAYDEKCVKYEDFDSTLLVEEKRKNRINKSVRINEIKESVNNMQNDMYKTYRATVDAEIAKAEKKE